MPGARRGPTQQLTRKAWLAASLSRSAGARHTRDQSGWSLLEQGIATRSIARAPSHRPESTYLVSMGFLWCKLPSGRCLAYGKPRLKSKLWLGS